MVWVVFNIVAINSFWLMAPVFCVICWRHSTFLRRERLQVNMLISLQHTVLQLCLYSLQRASFFSLHLQDRGFSLVTCFSAFCRRCIFPHLVLLFLGCCSLVPFTSQQYSATKIILKSQCPNILSHLIMTLICLYSITINISSVATFSEAMNDILHKSAPRYSRIDSTTTSWSTAFALQAPTMCFKCTHIWHLLPPLFPPPWKLLQNQTKSRVTVISFLGISFTFSPGSRPRTHCQMAGHTACMAGDIWEPGLSTGLSSCSLVLTYLSVLHTSCVL